jgi:hypothetical protein
MALPDDQIIYSLSVEDVRQVLSDEGLRELSDDELRLIEDRLGDLVPWYELVLSAIREAVPELNDDEDEEDD